MPGAPFAAHRPWSRWPLPFDAVAARSSPSKPPNKPAVEKHHSARGAGQPAFYAWVRVAMPTWSPAVAVGDLFCVDIAAGDHRFTSHDRGVTESGGELALTTRRRR